MSLRPKIDRQNQLVVRPPVVHRETQRYYDRYETLSRVLDENPGILDAVHKDVHRAITSINRGRGGKRFRYTTDQIFRMILVQAIEGWPLRETCLRIDDGSILRVFTRIGMGPMLHPSHLCNLKNAIRPETWRTVNGLLARYSVRRGLIEGKKVRLDTTAVETNIHYPTDSSLMSDCSRVLCRLIGKARDVDPDAVGPGRLQHRRTKRLADQISRATQRKKQVSQEQLRPTYEKLMQRVERTLSWASEVSTRLRLSLHAGRFGVLEHAMVQAIVQDLAHFAGLTERVLDQTRRRILHGEVVPSKEKVLSIFEPHTELLIRGKAGKRIEYGHMIQIQQVEGNFVTDYGVFARRPAQESDLLESVIASHERLFGGPPEVLAADKGYFPGMVALRALEKNVELVAIGKKGRRTEEETEREHAVLFRLAQRFRAGIEGTISYLKRAFRLFRCFNKGWQHYVSTIGATIFAHNLVALVRLET